MNSQTMIVCVQLHKKYEPLTSGICWLLSLVNFFTFVVFVKACKNCFSCNRKISRWMACEINSRCHYSHRLCSVSLWLLFY